MEVSLLTGMDDKAYMFGLVRALIKNSVKLEVVGGDGIDFPEWHGVEGIRFLNLKHRLDEPATHTVKLWRILLSYASLLRYTWSASPNTLHIIWNNKLEYLDRTALMLYYKFVLGKRVILTAHNVNKAKRDHMDTYLNRLTLRVQYRLCDWIFVHTEEMRRELVREFGCSQVKVSVIPFGIDDSRPNTNLTTIEAKKRLEIGKDEKTILFFGRIVPYKGLEYLVEAFQDKLPASERYRLVVAGRPEKDSVQYLEAIRKKAKKCENITWKIGYVPDAETEVYFKAADVLVLPYRNIYQSGVLFLGYNFGLPVIASAVGGLCSEIIEGQTGFIVRPEDSTDLGRVIEKYFSSDLYRGLAEHRSRIQQYAHDRYSWQAVGELTMKVYEHLSQVKSHGREWRI